MPRRPETTPVEIETSEHSWWQTFAELEDRFAWVQTPSMQRILRGRYLQEIVRRTAPDGQILELGCGTGWLCLMLARLGAKSVCGVDFSSAQIARANLQAEAAGLTGRVRFHCVDGTRADQDLGSAFDCVVVHAFLHHLDQTEIRRTLSTITHLLKPKGVFIVFEPVRSDRANETLTPRWIRWQWILARWSQRGRWSGFRRDLPEETHWRELFARRSVGIPPHGPSPKEMPFSERELEEYLHPDFIIERQQPCMVVSHLIVQEWLLRGLSHPSSTALLLPWIARLTAWMDRRAISRNQLPGGLWIFSMFVCRRRS